MAKTGVILTDAEVLHGKEIGLQVVRWSDAHGCERRTHRADQFVYENIEGYAAKLAFGKLFGLEYAPPEGGRCHQFAHRGDMVYDFVLDGKTIAVRSTPVPTGRLTGSPHLRANPADYYVLMVGASPAFDCRGFMSGKTLFEEHRRGDLGRGPVYLAEQWELVPTIG